MKKILLLLLVACLLMSFAACGSSGETETNAPETEPVSNGETYATEITDKPDEDETGFVFHYNGTEIALHASAEPIVEALGEPKKYTESASCAFKGLDKTYFYGSFYMDTYPVDGKDYVYGWWFADDSVATEEGIYIGSSQTDVEAAYGADTFNGTNAYIITRDGGTLTVIVEDGVVSSIQYAIILD